MEVLYALALGILSAVCLHRKSKRHFNRINQFGVEQFESYGKKIVSNFIDTVLQLAGIGLLSAGILVLTLKYAEDWVWLAAILFVVFAIEEMYFRDRGKMSHVKALHH